MRRRQGHQGRRQAQAIAAYRKFLDSRAEGAAARRGDAPPRRPRDGPRRQRAVANGERQARRARLHAAIARYQEYLKAYPKDPGNDRVLYQLARAQEQGGELEAALKTLDRLVRRVPEDAATATKRSSAAARCCSRRATTPRPRQAYATVLKGDAGNPYHERALYMQGWSLFKQGRLEDALHSFFGVLDLQARRRRRERRWLEACRT